MGDLGGTLSTALALVSVATLAGLGLMRGSLTSLRETVADLRGEVADKDRHLADKDQRIELLDRRCTELQHDLDALGRVVTGEVHWKAIATVLDQHHQEAREHWRTDESLLTSLRDEVRGLRDESG